MTDPIAAPPATQNGMVGKVLTAALSVVVTGLLFVADKMWTEKEEMQAAHVVTMNEMSALQSTVESLKADNSRTYDSLEAARARLGDAEVLAAKMQERLEGARERMQRLYEQLMGLDVSLQREMRDRDEIGSVELDGVARRLQDEIAARERLMLETIRGLGEELREALRGIEREVFEEDGLERNP